jgi:hypothetical protein
MTNDDEPGRPMQRRIAPVALYLVALISFLGSISWILHRNRLLSNLFQLCFAAAVGIWLLLIVRRVWRLSRGAGHSEFRTRQRVYAFPRRFGLGTLLVITLVFGALSAYFRWLQWPGEVVLAALCFVGLISGMQFAFDRAPRHISILVGSLGFAAWPIAMWLLAPPNFNRFNRFDIAFLSATCAVLGAIVGYCTGTLVGGIFLSMDAATTLLKKAPNRPSDQA